jgi:hypothetical protein
MFRSFLLHRHLQLELQAIPLLNGRKSTEFANGNEPWMAMMAMMNVVSRKKDPLLLEHDENVARSSRESAENEGETTDEKTKAQLRVNYGVTMG